MMGHTLRRCRPDQAVAGSLIIALTLVLLAVGCSDDESIPPFSTVPELPVRPWFLDIWGSGASGITIVGRPGLIVHSPDGSTWTVQTSPTNATLTGVWGNEDVTPNALYACGHDGVILRNSGGGWGLMGSGTIHDLYDIGRGPGGDVYVCGDRGELLRLAVDSWATTADAVVHRDDSGAVDDTLYRSEGEFAAFTAIGPMAVFGAPARTRLGTHVMTSLIPDSQFGWQLIAVEGRIGYLTSTAGDASVIPRNWLTSDLGRLYRLQETSGRLSWKEKASPSLGDAITCVWGVPGGQIYYFTTRSGKIIRGTVVGDNDNMTHTVVYPGGIWLSAIWGSSATDIYAVGYNAMLLHYDGSGWTPIQVSLPSAKAATPGEPETDKYGQPLW